MKFQLNGLSQKIWSYNVLVGYLAMGLSVNNMQKCLNHLYVSSVKYNNTKSDNLNLIHYSVGLSILTVCRITTHIIGFNSSNILNQALLKSNPYSISCIIPSLNLTQKI